MEEPTQPIETAHSIDIKKEKLYYKAETGYLPLKDEEGNIKANIFYTAYFKDSNKKISKRPITFAFNGGPGSSSIWLHIGALGPKRVEISEEGEPTKPPYNFVDNEYTWLDRTDLVFIDPVTTGYSRALENEEKKYHEFKKDIESVGDFIRRFVDKKKRWGSPKYIAGESYGTTRAAGLSGYLQDRYGMYLNGIMLLSAVTNFQTISFDSGNDLPYLLFLPSYTATAYYHDKLEGDLNKDLEDTLKEVKEFVIDDYSVALMKGNKLKRKERKRIVRKLSDYTGLSERYIENTNLRINIYQFTKELLRDQSKSLGRLDSRVRGENTRDIGEYNDFDPSYNKSIYGTFSTCLNDYLLRELKYENELPYEVLTGRVHPWDFSEKSNQYVEVSSTLTEAIHKNPHLKVWIANGYYDLATPFFATEYTVNHMEVAEGLRDNIKLTYYNAGHMMYIHMSSLKKLKNDFQKFLN
ncbi:MAG: peptidase S10 [Candidatus Mcinerneyibacterium aminivorans]|uniref:Peptidase S10 n=1 Tax=Candidatus Mcinerneyibacterium aminivorans TaxID=2703815 RepID=A0A5D0MG35_9BACT|nr:MAG: peptidase S10 [Candidatus Mcinerneyibacterium aminivorans]